VVTSKSAVPKVLREDGFSEALNFGPYIEWERQIDRLLHVRRPVQLGVWYKLCLRELMVAVGDGVGPVLRPRLPAVTHNEGVAMHKEGKVLELIRRDVRVGADVERLGHERAKQPRKGPLLRRKQPGGGWTRW